MMGIFIFHNKIEVFCPCFNFQCFSGLLLLMFLPWAPWIFSATKFAEKLLGAHGFYTVIGEKTTNE